jgi:uncharacterized oligopeptide transporter (OPT) family protein
MPCLFVLLMLAFPRVAIVLLYFLTNFLDRAYHSALLILVLGFLFLPVTTIVYAWIVNIHQPVAGIYLVAILVSAVLDLGLIGHGEYRRRS